MSSTAFDYLLIDCNAFFVSCERVFNPQLRKKAVVVLSSNDGCVVARSEEAKALNIAMGAPYFHIKTLLDSYQGVALSSNFPLYADMSHRVMAVICHFCEKVEVYSIDEAFVEIASSDETLPFFLIDVIKQWTGLPVTIGRASTKTLAKLASDAAKKKQEAYLHLKGNIDTILNKVPIADIWGIGKKNTSKLQALQIITALDLKNFPGFALKKEGSVLLQKTALELAGYPCLLLDELKVSKQSITYSRSFGKTEDTFEGVHAALSYYIQRASSKLRDENLLSKTMNVFLQTSPFDKTPYSNNASIHLSVATDDTPFLIEQGRLILKKIFIEGYHYKKVGITFMELQEAKHEVLDLFEKKDPKRKEAIRALDAINLKYGSRTLEYASCQLSHSYHQVPLRKSGSYTTSWSELLEVN